MKMITLSEQTYNRLHRHSTSFEDEPEDVIVRLLDQVDGDSSASAGHSAPSESASRAAPGSLLPLSEYWIPILRILSRRGGSAPSHDVLEALEEEIAEQLTDRDREPLKSGAIRWRNRARFARLRMKERGLLSDSSHRGVWEITPVGSAYLKLNESTP